MEITAFSKSVQVAPRKVRIVADVIRKQNVETALTTLSFLRKRGSTVLLKTLESAVANAVNKNLPKEGLVIKRIDISEGPAYKRFHPSTRGRIHPYKKKTSHIRIILSSKEQVKPIEVKKEKKKEEVKK